MKITTIISALFVMLMMVSCANYFTTVSTGKKIDTRLIGTWAGAETDKQIEGFHKSWEMVRNADGTFKLDFKFNQNGTMQQVLESGSWWVENGKFYEYHNESKKTDIYEYTVLNNDQVKFKSRDISVGMNTDSYEFIDHRK